MIKYARITRHLDPRVAQELTSDLDPKFGNGLLQAVRGTMFDGVLGLAWGNPQA